MNTEAPFPNDVRMSIAYYVGRWYVIVRTRVTYQGSAVLMMRPFPTYDDARRFQYSHVSR
jgi:hypothetical protein